MRYAKILEAFYATPLALLPEKIEAVRRFLHTKADSGEIPADEIRAAVAERERPAFAVAMQSATRRPDGALQIGRVGIVSVFGVIMQRASLMSEYSGAVSAERLGATIDSLVNDRSVKSIVMVFDSPGGGVFGVQELGAKIRAARDQKKIVGTADSVAASAAFWLIAQCSEICVTPGGQVGSVGVYGAHDDFSGWQQKQGIKTTLVSAGEYKVESSPFGPLSDEARAEMQRHVDAYYAMFLAEVAKGRGVSVAKVREDYGKGRMAMAQEAVEKGMADRVATLDQVLKRLGAYEGQESGVRSQGTGITSAQQAAVIARTVELQESA